MVVDMALLCRNPTVNHLRSLLVRNPSQMKWAFLCWTPTLPGGNGPVHNSQQILLRSLRRAPCPSRVSPPFLAITYTVGPTVRTTHVFRISKSTFLQSVVPQLWTWCKRKFHTGCISFLKRITTSFSLSPVPTSCPLRISKAMPSLCVRGLQSSFFTPILGQ